MSANCFDALKAFRAAGGVVDFFAYDCESGGADAHLEATLAAHPRLDRGKLRGEPQIESWISAEEFLGSMDTSLGEFRDPGAYFRARAHGESACMIIRGGFVYAFTDPPYSLGPKSPEQADEWWETISRELFNNYQNLEIAQWKTDWSSYFEAGLEWWGAHWWTVHNKAANLLIVVAASATD